MLKATFVIFVFLFLTTASFAQVSSSRQIKTLSVNVEKCALLAKTALGKSGYTVNQHQGALPGDYYYTGSRPEYSATLSCNSTIDGKTWVIAFVAGNKTSEQLNTEASVLLANVVEVPPDGENITWTSNVIWARRNVGQRYKLNCPAGGKPDENHLWGTDVYTDDSYVCTAAAHYGLITKEEGGSVVVEILPGQSSYKGTSRNGLTSKDYQAWHGSYKFVSSQK